MGRRHAEVFLELLKGEGFAEPNPRPMFPNPPGLLRLEPHSPGLRERIWWGSASNATAVWAAKMGMNLQSSTLKADETGEPFHVQQAKQIRAYRAGLEGGRPCPRAARLGLALDLRADERPRPRTISAAATAATRSASSTTCARCSAAPMPPSPRPADRAAARRRGDRRGGHAAADGAQPARRRLQRACHREPS